MKRKYENDETADDVIYFVGTEIEHTSEYSKPTLFKTGERPLAEILHYLMVAEEKVYLLLHQNVLFGKMDYLIKYIQLKRMEKKEMLLF